MPLTAKDIGDMVKSTLDDLGRLRFQQIAQNLVDYEVFNSWFKKDKVSFDSGIGIKRTLMTKLTGAAKHVGLMDTDSVTIKDVIEQLEIPWRHAQTSWGFIYQETLMNRGGAMVVNVVKPRRAAALIDLVEELEDKAWSAPAAANKTEPYGVPYWITKSSDTGFNGGDPTGHEDTAGIDRDTTPNFRNYTAQYASVSKTDLIKKLRTAHRKCGFKSPITIQDYRGTKGQRYRNYVNESVISSVEDLGEAQNENLGRDIASMDGTITFRNHPVIWVPKLDSDTKNPWYGLDHSTFYPVCLTGDYLRESDAKQAPNQHNVYQVFVDLSYNFLCVDPRRNWVMATA